MHYYQHNIADYRKDTAHLSLLEHGIYRQLLDTYYLDEKPIETHSVIRRLSIKTEEERKALNNVFADFFEASECGNYHHKKRCDEEIAKYTAKADIARANGSKGGRPKKPKKTQLVNSANPEKSGSKANSLTHKPLTHKLIKEKEKETPSACDSSLVFDFWKKCMSKTGNTKFTPDRKSKIKARLKNYSVKEIQQAISNVSKNKFLMDGGHNDLTLICRNDSKLEGYRDMKQPPKSENDFDDNDQEWLLQMKRGQQHG